MSFSCVLRSFDETDRINLKRHPGPQLASPNNESKFIVFEQRVYADPECGNKVEFGLFQSADMSYYSV